MAWVFVYGIAMTRTFLSLAMILAGGTAAYAQPNQGMPAKVSLPTATAGNAAGFEVFTPRPSRKTRFDYSLWDDALEAMVFDLGPSLRERAKTVRRSLGSNQITGHTSAYRLEGSRFTFTYVDDSYEAGLAEYRRDLQELGTKYDIATLSKDEQLAYWLNLHNVALIEKVASAYPVKRPSRIKIDVNGEKQPLDTAKFITVKGVPLSLNDIRTKIVFPNWPERPNAIYGFFRADVGSPSISDRAYTRDRLGYLLTTNAEEFTNSLRGFNLGRRTRNVSEIYREAAPFYFPEMGDDLVRHLTALARPEVEEQMRKPLPFKFEAYEDTVADLSGGRGFASSGNPNATARISGDALRLIGETREKYIKLEREGLIGQGTGVVIIEDIATEDLAPDPDFSPLLNSGTDPE